MEYSDPLLASIAERLNNDDSGIRRVATMELVDSTEPEAVSLLMLALADSDPDVRLEAAKVIDEFDAEDMTDALVEALTSADENVRNAAAHALADLKDPAAAPALLAALSADDETADAESVKDGFVIAGILRALKPLKVEDSKSYALNYLGHEDSLVRREAVGVLGYLRDEQALPQLIHTAHHDTDNDVRRAAVGALVFASHNKVEQALISALSDEHWQVRAEAANIIGRLELSNAIAGLMTCSADDYWQVREKSVEALGKLGAVESIEVLGRCAEDAISNLRKASIAALGEIGHSSGIPFVEKALADNDPDVRKLARWAMGKIAA